jgi:hypothetical protein
MIEIFFILPPKLFSTRGAGIFSYSIRKYRSSKEENVTSFYAQKRPVWMRVLFEENLWGWILPVELDQMPVRCEAI